LTKSVENKNATVDTCLEVS